MKQADRFFKRFIVFVTIPIFLTNCFGNDIPELQLEPRIKQLTPTPRIILGRGADIFIPPVRFKGIVTGLPIVIPNTDIAIVEVKIIDPDVGAKRMAFVPANYKILNGQVVYLRVVTYSIPTGPQNERVYIVERE